jgi:hypothetical protein
MFLMLHCVAVLKEYFLKQQGKLFKKTHCNVNNVKDNVAIKVKQNYC